MKTFGVTGIDTSKKFGSLIIDYSQETFTDAANINLATPELSLTPPAAGQYQYSKTIAQVPTDAIDKVNSLMFQYRPLYNAFNLPAKYDANSPSSAIDTSQYVGIIAVRNTVTGQVTYIAPDKAIYSTFTNSTATLFQAVPLIIVIEGAIPFYAKPGDNIEIVKVDSAGANLGIVKLQICNFDVAPYCKTSFGPLYHAAT